MNYVVFDIETKNTFEEVGSTDPSALSISVVGVYEKNTDKVLVFDEKEFDAMWPIFERADVIIGYNSDHFDIPILNKYYHGDLKRIRSIDLLSAIKDSSGRRPKLDHVANATLGKNKIGHGLDAVTWWKNGEIEKIKEYCAEDVLITKEIFEYILKNGFVKVPDKITGIISEVKVDPSNWIADKEKATLTKSLF